MGNRRKLRGRDWEAASRLVRTDLAGHEDQIRAAAEVAAPGFNDQLQAAAAEGEQFDKEFRRRAKERLPGQCFEADANQVPQQVSDQIYGLYIRVTTELATGARQGCRHISIKTPVQSIAPVYADWIRCFSCYMSQPTDVPLTEREEHTCDLCGSYRPDQHMDSIFPQIGPMMLIIGICPACLARIQAA